MSKILWYYYGKCAEQHSLMSKKHGSITEDQTPIKQLFLGEHYLNLLVCTTVHNAVKH